MANATVVTFAWTDGAEAEPIARAVARRLGFRYVNNEIIDRAAQQAGADSKAVASVEHRQPLLSRIMRAIAIAGDAEVGVYDEAAADHSPEYRALIQEVVRQVASEGRVVIGTHGAGMRLAGTPGVLRVFVTASTETRVARVASERGISTAEARKEVEHGDHERKAYFERFFKVGHELPTHYDFVINTDVLPGDAVVGLITAAAE